MPGKSALTLPWISRLEWLLQYLTNFLFLCHCIYVVALCLLFSSVNKSYLNGKTPRFPCYHAGNIATLNLDCESSRRDSDKRLMFKSPGNDSL